MNGNVPAERYVGPVRRLMDTMLAEGVKQTDLVGVCTWAIALFAIAVGATAELAAFRESLRTHPRRATPPEPTGQNAQWICQGAQYLPAVGEVWKLLLIDRVPEPDIADLLFDAVRTAAVQQDLAVFSIQHGVDPSL